MYIENKDGDGGIVGDARIGRVKFSKSGKSLYYSGKMFESLKGASFKANYIEPETGEHYWISGCHKDGRDALYNTTVEIDEDVREEYWLEIRNQPNNKHLSSIRMMGKY